MAKSKYVEVSFNHYRGEGGTAEEIAADYEVTAKSEEIHYNRMRYDQITITGEREKVIGFLEDYALYHMVKNYDNDDSLSEDNEDTTFLSWSDEEEED